MYVCMCRAVTESEVRAVVAEGASDAEQVVARCGAGTGCGGCRNALRELLASCGIHVQPCPLSGSTVPVGALPATAVTMTTMEGTER